MCGVHLDAQEYYIAGKLTALFVMSDCYLLYENFCKIINKYNI